MQRNTQFWNNTVISPFFDSEGPLESLYPEGAS